MDYQNFEVMKRKAVLYDTLIRKNEALNIFKESIKNLDEYEEKINDSTRINKVFCINSLYSNELKKILLE